MPDHRRLAVLIRLRKAAGVTLTQMAHACGLRGKRAYESAAAWERGESVPRPSVRDAFLLYLAHALNLAADCATLTAVWDVLAEEWGWEPLQPADWTMIERGLLSLPAPEGDADTPAPSVSTSATRRRRSAPAAHNAYALAHSMSTSITLQKRSAPISDSDAHASALLLNSVPDPGPLPPGSVLPFAPHPHFVGRTTEMLALARLFLHRPQAAMAPVRNEERGQAPGAFNSTGSALRVALTGPGGIGKTQLAIEFAHRFGCFFPGGVFWVSFASADALLASVAVCGDAMNFHPRFDRLSLDDQAQLVMRAWEDDAVRLLIFDNCDDEALLDRWLPRRGASRVLVTSRRATWKQQIGLTRLRLGVLSRAQSVELLRRHCPLAQVRDEELVAIAAELDDLPLALHLAGSYLSRGIDALTPAQYLAELRQSLADHERALTHPSLCGKDSHGRPLPAPTGHLNHFERMVALSLEQLDRNNRVDALAYRWLLCAAQFAP
ncbi:MAG: hypothetical protein NZ699_15845, partial [Roseiflexus sp.]|nr:hypothetical protein [Roseiflexus sp.]